MSKFVCIYHVREQILRKKFEISCNLSLDAMQVGERRGPKLQLRGAVRTSGPWVELGRCEHVELPVRLS